MVYINILNLYLAYCCVFLFLCVYILFYIVVYIFMCLLRCIQIVQDLNKVEHQLLHNIQIIIHK